jgi:hypothetical protein
MPVRFFLSLSIRRSLADHLVESVATSWVVPIYFFGFKRVWEEFDVLNPENVPGTGNYMLFSFLQKVLA